MENSGTLDFAYHNSTDSKYHNEYIIIPGAEIDASLAGYYYVGFDFYAHGTDIYPANKNMDVERDWVFTDWIVRISPAEFIGSQRIFVEDIITSADLSKVQSSDWDFNDAVFDAFIIYDEWNPGNTCAVITLRAAGGTLPLTVAGKEVHELFGVSQKTMVNTGAAGGAEKAPVQFRLTKDEIISANANDIKVVVTDAKGQKIELTAKVGEAEVVLILQVTSEENIYKREVVIVVETVPSFFMLMRNLRSEEKKQKRSFFIFFFARLFVPLQSLWY